MAAGDIPVNASIRPAVTGEMFPSKRKRREVTGSVQTIYYFRQFSHTIHWKIKLARLQRVGAVCRWEREFSVTDVDGTGSPSPMELFAA